MREPRSTPPGRMEGLSRLPPLHLPRSRPLSGCRDEGPKGMSGSGSPRGGSSGASKLTGFPAGQSGRPARRVLFGDWSAAEATGRTASPGVSCMRGGGFGKENGSGCGEAVAAAAAESPPDILAAGPAAGSSSPPLLASTLGAAGGRPPEAARTKRMERGPAPGGSCGAKAAFPTGPAASRGASRRDRAAAGGGRGAGPAGRGAGAGGSGCGGAERRGRWETAHVGRGRGARSRAAPAAPEGRGGKAPSAFSAAFSSRPRGGGRAPLSRAAGGTRRPGRSALLPTPVWVGVGMCRVGLLEARGAAAARLPPALGARWFAPPERKWAAAMAGAVWGRPAALPSRAPPPSRS